MGSTGALIAGPGGGAKVAAAAVEADEACPMAHITALALRLIGGSKAGPHVQPGLAAARAACDARGSAWEQRHLEIVQAYASPDDDGVGDLYTALVADYPFDILALSLAFIHNSPARRAALAGIGFNFVRRGLVIVSCGENWLLFCSAGVSYNFVRRGLVIQFYGGHSL